VLSFNSYYRNFKHAALSFALSVGILSSQVLPASASAWQNVQIPALQGIKSVAIVVSSHGDGAARLGLNEAKLQSLIMQQISSAGIPLHSGGPIKDKPDVACFEIDTHLVIVEDTSTHRPIGLTYAIEGFILDSVATKRRAGISSGTLGILWKASGAHGYLPGEHIRSFGSIVQKVVNEFVQDYYTANGQKKFDTTAKVTKQLPTISLSGQSETVQTVKEQVVSHMTPTQATPLQRLIDEQNVSTPALTTYQKPREVAAVKPAAPPPAPAPAAAPAPQAKIETDQLEEAIPEDQLTSDQVALLQAKAQALHQQAINLQHQVLLQQISQLQSQAARLNERALARQAKKVDETTIQQLQAKQAALQKNIAQQTALLSGKPVEAAVRVATPKPAKKKLVAAKNTTPSASPVAAIEQKVLADALVNQNSQINTPVARSKKPESKPQPAIQRPEATRPIDKSILPPQAVTPRVDVQQVKIAQTQPPAIITQPAVAAQPVVAQKPIDSRPQPTLTLAQMIAAQNAADSQQVAALPYHQPAARTAPRVVASQPATVVVKPSPAAVTAKQVKPAVIVERDLSPKAGPPVTTQPLKGAAKSTGTAQPNALVRARKKLLRLPWKSDDAPAVPATTTAPAKNRVL
jgi:hypothetical protein